MQHGDGVDYGSLVMLWHDWVSTPLVHLFISYIYRHRPLQLNATQFGPWLSSFSHIIYMSVKFPQYKKKIHHYQYRHHLSPNSSTAGAELAFPRLCITSFYIINIQSTILTILHSPLNYNSTKASSFFASVSI